MSIKVNGTKQANRNDNRTLFFITASTYLHRPLLSGAGAEGAVKQLFDSSREYDARLLAYVLMPTHIHLIASFPDRGSRLSKFVVSLKSGIRRDYYDGKMIWQSRFDSRVIGNEPMFRQMLGFIHNNPVKSGIVDSTADYPHSSARVWNGNEQDDRIWTDVSQCFHD